MSLAHAHTSGTTTWQPVTRCTRDTCYVLRLLHTIPQRRIHKRCQKMTELITRRTKLAFCRTTSIICSTTADVCSAVTLTCCTEAVTCSTTIEEFSHHDTTPEPLPPPSFSQSLAERYDWPGRTTSGDIIMPGCNRGRKIWLYFNRLPPNEQ